MIQYNIDTGGRPSGSAAYIVEIEIAADDLFFAETMSMYREFRGALAPYQSTNTIVRSLFHTRAVEYGSFEDAVRTDSTVNSVNYVRTVQGEHIYDLEVVFVPECLFRKLGSRDVQLLGAVGRDNTWTVLTCLPSDGIFEEYRRLVDEQGIGGEIQHVYRMRSPDPMNELTPAQRETIEVALELGYFNIPRAVSMQELAGELGITPNAVSERLRRTERKLLSALFENPSNSNTSDD